ncbi:hypothetical protein [Gryllotalpicola koreensis]|uniref:Recombinase RecT n=1 Tax=Gryllotalpicola koreensis TaxID=993086 RepID=A0ABP8A2R4_9MICO
MSTEITPYGASSMGERQEYARTIAQAGELIPRGLWSPMRKQDGTMGPPAPNAAKVLLVMEYGAMLGFHPIAALSNIAVIDGKPAMSAQLMAAKVRSSGVKLRVTTQGSWKDGTFEAIAELIRPDDPDFTFRAVWTRERAERAGLLNKDNWKHYGENMAKARAISEVAREGAQDYLLGVVYTPEELGAAVDEGGQVIEGEIEPSEPSRDWAQLLQNETDIEQVKVLISQAREAGEMTDKLQSLAFARMGSLAREQQAPVRFEPADDEPIEGESVDE